MEEDFKNILNEKVESGLNNIKSEMISLYFVENTKLEELSKNTLGNYIKKAQSEVSSLDHELGRQSTKNKTNSKLIKKAEKREHGIHKAVDKLTKESVEESAQLTRREREEAEQKRRNAMKRGDAQSFVNNLDDKVAKRKEEKKKMREDAYPIEELSKKTLSSYIKKATVDYGDEKHFRGVTGVGHSGSDEAAAKSNRKLNKRFKGILRASDKLAEENLEEQKIVIRVNSKGVKSRKIRCGSGRVVKNVNGRQVCVTPTGREKMSKKMAIRQANRTKRSKGTGYKRRVNFKRQRAIRKRRQMGL